MKSVALSSWRSYNRIMIKNTTQMDEKGKYNDSNHNYYLEMKKLQKERQEWLEREGVKNEKEWLAKKGLL